MKLYLVKHTWRNPIENRWECMVHAVMAESTAAALRRTIHELPVNAVLHLRGSASVARGGYARMCQYHMTDAEYRSKVGLDKR